MAPAPELPSRDRALVTRRETGVAQSLEAKVRAGVQRSGWAQRKDGASEISQRHYREWGVWECDQAKCHSTPSLLGLE